jgi:lipid-A-disaccharide synthase
MSDDPKVIVLPAPSTRRVDLLVVAAEHSGDEHAARMVRELRERRPDTNVCALGGPRLAAAGAQLLRDLTKSSAMGFAVIGKLSYYRALIAEVVRWVGEYRPQAVCFVDSSGLNLRIARLLFERKISAKAGGSVKTLYYISPQIWASRAGRRFQMAEHLDGLASIFPFEQAVYADTKLPVEFVGHPFVAADHVPPVRFDPDGPVLLLPGSRRGPVSRIFPVLLEAFRRGGGGRAAVVLYPSDEILAVLRAANPPANVQLVRMGDTTEPVGAAAVLTSSGTMSMHCALAGIPGAVTYRADPLTYFLGRLLVKVKFIGIANLLLGEAMYPEFVQGAATPDALARELQAALVDPVRRTQTAEQAARLRALLSQKAAGSAAEWIARQLGG